MAVINYTIVIPHFNIPDLLGRCLRSIPNREDIQVIVVDDNSPNNENYLSEVCELTRENVEFYVTYDKKGAGHVRNVAFPYIKGKKVLFADADDFYVDDFEAILDEYKDDKHDLIYFNTKSCLSNDITKSSNRTKDGIFKIWEETGSFEHFRYRYTEPWGKIYSYELIFNNGILFDETIVSNDQMFSVKTAFAAKDIMVVDKPLYVVTTREDSLSFYNVDTIEKLLTRLDVNSRVQIFLKEKGVSLYPMPVFYQMVNLLHRKPYIFFQQLVKLHSMGISVRSLLWQIFMERILSPSKRKRIQCKSKAYINS